jgi:hypothetical protein
MIIYVTDSLRQIVRIFEGNYVPDEAKEVFVQQIVGVQFDGTLRYEAYLAKIRDKLRDLGYNNRNLEDAFLEYIKEKYDLKEVHYKKIELSGMHWVNEEGISKGKACLKRYF